MENKIEPEKNGKKKRYRKFPELTFHERVLLRMYSAKFFWEHWDQLKEGYENCLDEVLHTLSLDQLELVRLRCGWDGQPVATLEQVSEKSVSIWGRHYVIEGVRQKEIKLYRKLRRLDISKPGRFFFIE